MKRRSLLRLAAAGAAAGIPSAYPAAVMAAPRARPWMRWMPHEPQSTEAIDHTAWDAVLARYVSGHPDGINRFAYGSVTAADRAALDRYLDALSATPIARFNRDQQFAFWVNLYNALTVRVVLDHYPVDSIRDIDISSGLFADGPWGRDLIEVDGTALTLDDIEHRILRPLWRDPRIHYAVSCASLGCPNLARTAFLPGMLETMLNASAHDYINHPRGAAIRDGRLYVSSLYDWFSEDFGGDDAGVIAHLRHFAQGALADGLADIRSVSGHAYDWRLNDAARPPPA